MTAVVKPEPTEISLFWHGDGEEESKWVKLPSFFMGNWLEKFVETQDTKGKMFWNREALACIKCHENSKCY